MLCLFRAHIGDAANVVCKISLSSEEILVEAVVVEAQVREEPFHYSRDRCVPYVFSSLSPCVM